MPKYQIVKNRVRLSDERFDYYLDESLFFFSKIESIVGSPPPIALGNSPELTNWQNERWKNIQDSLANCRHKIQAINYSLSLINSEVKFPPIIGQNVVPINLNETEFLDDVILFEFESFLLQVMSTLDVFVHLLRLFYPALDSKDEHTIGFNGLKGRAGKKTTNVLRKQDSKLADYIDNQVDLWIQNVYSLRNITAHRSKVSNLQMFLIDKHGIHAPKFLGDQVDLLDFCQNTYNQLKTFLTHIEESFLLPKSEKFYETPN